MRMEDRPDAGQLPAPHVKMILIAIKSNEHGKAL